MSYRPTLFVALRILLGRRRGGGSRPYLRGAVVGMALAIVPLSVVLFVTNGMIEAITARYLETSTYHLQAAPSVSLSAQDLEAASAKLRALPGLSGAFAEMQGPAIALASPRAGKHPSPKGALVRAIEPGLLKDPGFRKYLQVRSGELEIKRSNDALVGQALAETLGLKVGDLFSLVSTRESGFTLGIKPRLTTLRVRAIVSTGYQELDALWLFLPLERADTILAPGSRRIFVGIKTPNAFGDLEGVQNCVKAALSPILPTDTGWGVETWMESERNLWKSFATTRALLVLIMALAVAVAAINIAASLITLVVERRKDIAILRSSGASSGQVGLIFVNVGILTGGLGTLLGLGVGVAIALSINPILSGVEVLLDGLTRLGARLAGQASPGAIKLLNPAYYLEVLPVDISFVSVASIALASLLLCGLASLIPARKAAMLPPMEIFHRA